MIGGDRQEYRGDGAGVYICMDGNAFKPENVKKNIGEGRFEEK